MEDTGSSEILMLVAPMAESARHAMVGVRMEDLFHGLHRLHCVVAQACAYLRVFHAGVLRVRAEACRWFTTLLNVQLDFFGECLLVRHVEVLHVRGARVCRWSSSSWMCSSASLARSLSTRHAMTHSCWRCNRRGFSIIDQKVGCGDLHDVFSKLWWAPLLCRRGSSDQDLICCRRPKKRLINTWQLLYRQHENTW